MNRILNTLLLSIQSSYYIKFILSWTEVFKKAVSRNISSIVSQTKNLYSKNLKHWWTNYINIWLDNNTF